MSRVGAEAREEAVNADGRERVWGVTEYKPPLNTLTCHPNCSNCQLYGPIRHGSLSTLNPAGETAERHLKFKSSFQIFQIKHGDNDINYEGRGKKTAIWGETND